MGVSGAPGKRGPIGMPGVIGPTGEAGQTGARVRYNFHTFQKLVRC